MTYIAAFFVSMAFVAAKSVQQLNVVHDNRTAILPCSMILALMEVSGVLIIVKSESFMVFAPIGFGSYLGCLIGMYLHKRLRNGFPDSGADQQSAHDARGIEIDGDLGNEWR
jgi:hypothetical protein